MTRETKIGLLVGLAFIIVIGILLSDHLTSSTDPPQATLAAAGNNVRSGVATPGVAGNPPITPVTTSHVTPNRTVPTPNEVGPRAQPVQPVQVVVGGPSRAQETPAATPVNSDDRSVNADPSADANSEPLITKAPSVGGQGSDQTGNQPPAAGAGDVVASALRNAARQHGEELVAVGQPGMSIISAPPSSAGAPGKQTPAGMKSYTAVEGDSVSKIATKAMGSNTKANRDAIVAANPSLKQDPNKIISGRTYLVPTAAGATVSTPAPTPAPSVASSAPPAAPGGENWYTVKENDSLWKIATEQCGSASAIPAIKELNKESIKGDTVVVNTKIRLPNKPLASAN